VFLSYRGSVNRWECDENDHLNVRFYMQKHWQALCGGAAELSWSSHPDPDELRARLRVQHVRFLRESRLAAPLSGFIGVVARDADSADVLTELRHAFTNELLSTCVHRFTGITAPPSDELPDDAAPRGVPDRDLAHSTLSLSDVADHGFRPIGLGVVQQDECGRDGTLSIHSYMARISDSMPHLWGQLVGGSGELGEDEGSAVLEYRLRYHRPLYVGQRFKIMSGVSDIDAKVLRFAHLICNTDDGRVCVSAEAAGICMDLRHRRIKVLPDDLQRTARGRLINSMNR